MKLLKIGKFIGSIGTALVLTLCLLGSLSSASASAITKNVIVENEISATSISRTIEVKAIYWGQEPIPSTIYYNSNGYRGTLYFYSATIETHYNPERTVAVYKGTVFCEGTCIAPTSQTEEQ